MIRKTDSNHKEILDQCRQIPQLSAFSTHIIGKGFPDIVIGYNGLNYLFEIKDGTKTKSARKLTTHESSFFCNWKGQVNIIHNIDDILEVLQIKK
jgi:hypothetical protein